MNPHDLPGIDGNAALDRLRSEIGKALVGQAVVVEQALVALLAGGHVLIEGLPGLGKTLLVRAVAKAVTGEFARIQFTPDLMPADITGHTLFDARQSCFVTRKGPVFAHLVLADEINRAPAKTQAALLELMQEGQVTIDGVSHPLPQPFMVFATENPVDHEGTYPLPEAQLDRFLLKVLIDYPAADDELALVRRVTEGLIGERLDVSAVLPCLDPATLLALREQCARARVHPLVSDYAVRMARATRAAPGIAVGASPRGSIALIRAARACALLDARDYVTPDDVKAVARPVLRHRIVLRPELEIEGVTVEQVLDRLLDEVAAPRA